MDAHTVLYCRIKQQDTDLEWCTVGTSKNVGRRREVGRGEEEGEKGRYRKEQIAYLSF